MSQFEQTTSLPGNTIDPVEDASEEFLIEVLTGLLSNMNAINTLISALELSISSQSTDKFEEPASVVQLLNELLATIDLQVSEFYYELVIQKLSLSLVKLLINMKMPSTVEIETLLQIKVLFKSVLLNILFQITDIQNKIYLLTGNQVNVETLEYYIISIDGSIVLKIPKPDLNLEIL